MARRTLDLIDVTEGQDGPRLGSVTLDGDQLTFEGDLPRQIMSGWLRQHSPAEVFDKFVGHSNGAYAFREATVKGRGSK